MNPRTSFLTGATGFLGSSLAVELLQRDRERIYCLVRPHGDVHERLRGAVVAAAEAAGVAHLVEDRLDRLVPLAGDIAAEDLGLSDEARAILAAAPADECWHSAASLRYEDRHKDEIVGTNVDGTRHLLDAITGLGIGELNHISTAYVAGIRTGEVHEEPFDPSYEPNNWYEASKRQGEELVVDRAGAFDRVRIMRPSIVIGMSIRSTSSSGYPSSEARRSSCGSSRATGRLPRQQHVRFLTPVVAEPRTVDPLVRADPPTAATGRRTRTSPHNRSRSP